MAGFKCVKKTVHISFSKYPLNFIWVFTEKRSESPICQDSSITAIRKFPYVFQTKSRISTLFLASHQQTIHSEYLDWGIAHLQPQTYNLGTLAFQNGQGSKLTEPRAWSGIKIRSLMFRSEVRCIKFCWQTMHPTPLYMLLVISKAIEKSKSPIRNFYFYPLREPMATTRRKMPFTWYSNPPAEELHPSKLA